MGDPPKRARAWSTGGSPRALQQKCTSPDSLVRHASFRDTEPSAERLRSGATSRLSAAAEMLVTTGR